jgi:hypothetical protein
LLKKNGSGTLKLRSKDPSMNSLKTQNDEPVIPDHGTRSSSESKILEWIDETFDVVVYPTGFEDCIVGVGERFGGPPVAVLDLEKMLTQLEKDGMTRDEAIEYFEFNILGAHIGNENPVYMHVPDFKLS